jgi:hypothetical protein
MFYGISSQVVRKKEDRTYAAHVLFALGESGARGKAGINTK